MSQATNYQEEINAMKSDAVSAVRAGRTAVMKKMKREIVRSWKYKDGKKKALKAGMTVSIAGVFVSVGVATHMVGLPIIAALAAGSFLVGKMNDAAFAKLFGRQYTGLQKTRNFVQGKSADFDGAELSKSLNSRAHKTLRRACQHYRKALEKLKEVVQANKGPARQPLTCEEATDRVMQLLSAKRHLDKSRLYAYPALYLSKALLNLCKEFSAIPFDGDGIDGRIRALMRGHEHADSVTGGIYCGSDSSIGNCYWEMGAHGELGSVGPPVLKELWIGDKLEDFENRLAKVKNVLEHDPIVEGPPSMDREVARLYDDASRKFANRSDLIRIKHSVTNASDRMTGSEKVAFGVSQVGSVVLTAASAGGGMGAHVALAEVSDSLAQGVQALIELGSETADRGIDAIVVDGALEAEAKSGTTAKGSHGGAQAGRAGQESIQMAAIHIFEMLKANDKAVELDNQYQRLQHWNDDRCETFYKILYEMYKTRHHLVKAGKFLAETIEILELLSEELETKLTELHTEHNKVVGNIAAFMAKNSNHGFCRHCYHTQVI